VTKVELLKTLLHTFSKTNQTTPTAQRKQISVARMRDVNIRETTANFNILF